MSRPKSATNTTGVAGDLGVLVLLDDSTKGDVPVPEEESTDETNAGTEADIPFFTWRDS